MRSYELLSIGYYRDGCSGDGDYFPWERVFSLVLQQLEHVDDTALTSLVEQLIPPLLELMMGGLLLPIKQVLLEDDSASAAARQQGHYASLEKLFLLLFETQLSMRDDIVTCLL